MSYGSTKDWFGLAAVAGIELQSNDKNPSYATEATSEDSNGDVVCVTKAGETNEVSATYKICGDTFNMDTAAIDLKVGSVKSYDTGTHYQITGFDVSTDNKEFPTLTVNGVQDPGATAGTHAEYTSGVSVIGKKKAQGFGLGAIVAGNKVISSNLSVSGNIATVEDSQGDIVKREPYGVKITTSNTLQNCTADPTAPADTANGYYLDNPLTTLSESNTDYGTATVSTFKQLQQDT